MTTANLQALREAELLSVLDVHFAHAMTLLAGEQDERVTLAAALVSRQVQNGHVCLDLPSLVNGQLPLDNQAALSLAWPDLPDWLSALKKSALVGHADQQTPLCLDAAGRLYLRRYFEHEHNLAQALSERARRSRLEVDRHVLAQGLDRLFGATRSQLDLFANGDRQRLAAERAVQQALCVISGGPGTGKTSTVVKILALIVEQALHTGRGVPRMHLLAPTGKAAARLQESIRRAKAKLACEPKVREAIAEDASTIHRALGSFRGHAQRFLHDQETPLATDVVVVDEASMVDVGLMARLFDAIPSQARLILLGDKNQLASVEAGAVLGDICGAGLDTEQINVPIADCIVQLTQSYRYAKGSGIERLADAIQAGHAEVALELLDDPALPDVAIVPETQKRGLPQRLIDHAVRGFEPFLQAQSIEQKLHALDAFRMLCAHRHGPYGQLALNAALEAELHARGQIAGHAQRYAGRPLLITQNDAKARLWNGDVGVLQSDPADAERLRASFLEADGRVREIATARLPRHESVYAMSVHKSQGSEFDEVIVVLPKDASPVLSRELLYTAVTRARQRVTLYGSPQVIAHAIVTSVRRASGLRDALWTK